MRLPDTISTDIAALLRGTVTTRALAERHHVSEADVELWKELVLRGLEARPRRSRALPALAAAGLLVVGVLATRAFAGTCASTLPAPLVTLCQNEPALASELNGNFNQLVTWVQQKVGTVGTAGITTTSINASSISTNSVSTNSLTASGGANISGSVTIGGNLTVQGTSFGAYSGGLSNDTTYTAATDGFVVGYFYGNTNGSRCYFHGLVDGTIRSTGGLHYFTNSDVYVNDDNLTFPVRRGSSWRVNLYNTSGSCNVNIAWVPLHP